MHENIHVLFMYTSLRGKTCSSDEEVLPRGLYDSLARLDDTFFSSTEQHTFMQRDAKHFLWSIY